MASVTQPLRDEHKELFPHVEEIRTVANLVGNSPAPALRQAVDNVYNFLAHHLIPHAQAEEQALYPVVGKVMGAPQATATMSRDHVEVDHLTERLASLRAKLSNDVIDSTLARDLREVLYGLYALIKVHFAKEEEVYLPLLEARLTPDEAQHMFKAMEEAAHEAKSHLVP